MGEFDVFLAHNSKDKPQVRNIAERLREAGINPWVDEEQIPPGRWFQDVIQQAMRDVRTAAIVIGPGGLGRWQELEVRVFVSQCIERGIPVIPVWLPGADLATTPAFLKELNGVKFERSLDENLPLNRLLWGITASHGVDRAVPPDHEPLP